MASSGRHRHRRAWFTRRREPRRWAELQRFTDTSYAPSRYRTLGGIPLALGASRTQRRECRSPTSPGSSPPRVRRCPSGCSGSVLRRCWPRLRLAPRRRTSDSSRVTRRPPPASSIGAPSPRTADVCSTSAARRPSASATRSSSLDSPPLDGHLLGASTWVRRPPTCTQPSARMDGRSSSRSTGRETPHRAPRRSSGSPPLRVTAGDRLVVSRGRPRAHTTLVRSSPRTEASGSPPRLRTDLPRGSFERGPTGVSRTMPSCRSGATGDATGTSGAGHRVPMVESSCSRSLRSTAQLVAGCRPTST
jgi:hypothetical protein